MVTLGSTNFDVDRVGLLENINDLKSSMFALEVSKSLTNRKSIHFGIYQPLRIESGNTSILIPKLYETNGDLNFEKTSFKLEPSGRQIDLSVGYKTKLSKFGDFLFLLSSSKDYQHIKSQDVVNSASAYIKFDF